MAYYIEFNNLGHLRTERFSAAGPIEAYQALKSKYPSAIVHRTSALPPSTSTLSRL